MQVLAFDIPTSATGVGMGDAKVLDFYAEATRRIVELPGVEGAAVGSVVPWRDAGSFPRFTFSVEGYTPADGEVKPRARMRSVSPRFFGVVGVPIVAGREFTEEDNGAGEPVVIISQSIAHTSSTWKSRARCPSRLPRPSLSALRSSRR